jgi:TPR repeat protein
MTNIHWGWLASVSFTCLACGAGGAAQAVKADAPTAADALGEAPCHEVAAQGEPLVVDWKTEQRSDLELAMKEGVAVVAYSCDGIRLLKDCHIDGQYGFLGMTRREQVVRLENADEVRANLPLSGGSVGGEVGRGTTLDIAMVLVGKTRTTLDQPTREDLKGSCDGATHYVRGALVGAFAMDRGSQAKVRAAAEILGMGASTSSSSSESNRNQDGDPADCKNATPDSPKPPSQCGAPVRLVLQAIAAAPPEVDKPVEATPSIAVVESACPKGLVFADGKCTNPAGAAAYQCKAGDADDCKAQCDRGHAGSCASIGVMLATGQGAAKDEGKAVESLRKACDGGESRGCTALGSLTLEGRGTAKDASAAATLFDRACKDGDAAGCGMLARLVADGEGTSQDPARAATLFQQACHGGYVAGCSEAANALVATDPAAAADLFKRACDGGHGPSCNTLGEMHEAGKSVRKDPIFASMLYQRGCIRGGGEACMNQGRMQLGGPGAGDEAGAKRSFERGCMFRSELACAALKVAYGDSRPVIPNVANAQSLRKTCQGGDARSCGLSGILTLAQSAANPMGKTELQRACTMGDRFACAIAKKVK